LIFGSRWATTPMILLCGNDSSNSLREPARPMVNGVTVPGNNTVSRTGKIGNVSGMCGGSPAAGPGAAGFSVAGSGGAASTGDNSGKRGVMASPPRRP